MISARVGSDAFVVWSVPYQAACALVPRQLTPTRFEDRGWIAFAAVELSQIRLAGCPLPGRFTLAAWLAVIDIEDGVRRGNLFLRLFTPSLLVRSALRLAAGPGLVANREVQIRRSPSTLQVHVDGEVKLALDRSSTVASSAQLRLDTLFSTNRSGIGLGRSSFLESRITKEHWHMRPHAASISCAGFIIGQDARLEFAFDASEDHACWAQPRILCARA